MAGRYALIVANNRYDDPALKPLVGPMKDAEALAGVLGDPQIGDFEVDLVLNQPQHLLRRRVNRFFHDRERDDTLLVHFSCHGLKDESGELFFAATDTEVDHLEDSALESGWLSRRIDASRSMKIVVLLDCCYSGAFTGDLTHRGGEAVHAIEPFGGLGRVVITASSAMQYSWERGDGAPSVFTSALVHGLKTGEADRDQDQWVSIKELYDYVFDAIRESGAKQVPQMKSDVQGELLVARSSYLRPVAPAPLPAEMVALLDSPVMSARLALVDDLVILTRKGGGQAISAREALERLTSDDSLRVRTKAAAALAPEAPVEPRVDTAAPAVPPPPGLVHADAVMGVAFSADGRRLATACRDCTARVWDAAGAELGRFEHDDWVIAVALSPDGQRLGTASRDRTARTWDVASGRELARMVHDSVVWDVTFSADGRRLATAAADGTARVWDADDGQEQERIPHDGAVVAARFSPDGRLLATAGSHGTAQAWDLAGGEEAACVTTGGTSLAVGFDAQGSALAAGAGSSAAYVWDVAGGRERARLDHEDVRAAAFAAPGHRVATAGDDGTARLFDGHDGRELARLACTDRIRALALSPDGRRLAIATGADVQLWTPA